MTTKTKKEIGRLETLIIKIDNNWETIDFITCFKSIEYLYGYYFYVNEIIKIIESEEHMVHSNKSQKLSVHIGGIAFPMNLDYLDYDPLNPFKTRVSSNYRNSMLNNGHLSLKKIGYASPGSIDFIGAGKIFDVLKEIVFKYVPNKKEKLELDILNLEKIEKEIKLLKDLGFDDAEIKAIFFKRDMAISSLKKLKDVNKIKEFQIEN